MFLFIIKKEINEIVPKLTAFNIVASITQDRGFLLYPQMKKGFNT